MLEGGAVLAWAKGGYTTGEVGTFRGGFSEGNVGFVLFYGLDVYGVLHRTGYVFSNASVHLVFNLFGWDRAYGFLDLGSGCMLIVVVFGHVCEEFGAVDPVHFFIVLSRPNCTGIGHCGW